MKKTMMTLAMAAGLALSARAEGVATGSPAPDFALKDSKGNTHELSSFKGKYVVLEWFNDQCPFVVKHYGKGHMQKLQKKYAEKDVVWLMVCSSAPGKQGHLSAEAVNAMLAKRDVGAKAYLLDEDGTVGRLYAAKTTPHLYIVNPEGVLIYQGGIDSIASAREEDVAKADNYVKEALAAAMAGEPVPNPTTKPYGCSVKY